MPTLTSIEWTGTPQSDGTIAPGFTSNPLRYQTPDGRAVWACVKVSPGCANCYSAALSERFTQRQAGPYNLRVMQGLTPYLDEKEMRRLLTSKVLSGKRVFMCDMTDLFGEWVPDEMIAAVFGIMAARPDVTFQVLTKHAERMARWFELHSGDDACMAENVASTAMMRFGVTGDRIFAVAGGHTETPWPLPNVWLGVSVEDQQRADERIPHLLRVPAAVRFLSVEPMLGLIDLRAMGVPHSPTLSGRVVSQRLDWVIVGGESGPGARPFDVSWVRSIVEQCRAAAVPVFVKQLGAQPVDDPLRWREWRAVGSSLVQAASADRHRVVLNDRKGGDMNEWPADLRVREWPKGSR